VQFDPALTPAERALILEELGILAAVRETFNSQPLPGGESSYDQAMLDLRDALSEARKDEIAQILTQIDSVASLSAHLEQQGNGRAADLHSPYFGHLRIRQGGRQRDVLIGNHTLILRGSDYPIIDWRHAPISRVFYRYREGDQFEEVFGGREVEGEILAHRRLTILEGFLVHIQCDQGVFQLDHNRWTKVAQALPALEGGAETAVRPGTVGPLELGVAHGGVKREDKHLSAITGLIDPEQFELITREASGIVTIDGGAGSGKTTIALHRMAYLAYRAPERFRPSAMLAVVFNKALAGYISRLLPALGVKGARIEVFEDLVAGLRRRHYPGLPGDYSDRTPFSVVRLKQHPATLTYLRERLEALEEEIRAAMAAATRGTPTAEAAARAWDELGDLPPALRVERLARWAAGKANLPHTQGATDDWLGRQRLSAALAEVLPDLSAPHTLARGLWEEAFLDLDVLGEAMARLAPGEFSQSQLEEVRDWAALGLGEREAYAETRAERLPVVAEEGEPPAPPPGPPPLDREDDTLLLLLYRMSVGPLRGSRRKPLRVEHLMVDEVQDFSPLELQVLLDLAAEPRSVTLAGDAAQKMILHNSFDTWNDVLAHLGLEGTAVSPLKVGYRSTAEIMRFAEAVLGPLAPERPWVPTRAGAPVELLRFTDTGHAVMVLATVLRELMRREPTANVALLARYADQAQVYYEGLERSELPRLRRVSEQNFSFLPGIEVTEVSQVKGLEYDYVVLLDADDASYPEDAASRYLLHIGATRAAHQLWLVACRNPSRLLPEGLTPRYL